MFWHDAGMHMFEQKINKRRRKNHSEARLAAIVDSSFDAIISKDLSGTIVSWNKAAERLFGFSAQEAIGRSIYILIPEDRHVEEVEIIRRLRLGHQIETFETLRNTRAGTLVPVSITISPIRDKRGRIIGASKIARDIAESKENERRLKLLMREVNHRVKNQYAVILAVISQTAARENNIRSFEKRVRERIMALSHSHDLLSSVDWAGVDLTSLASHQIQPFETSGRFSMSGPDILLDSTAVLNIGMALHELVINRVQFADAKQSDVDLSWTVERKPEGDEFRLIWRETGVGEPDLLARGNGFGSLVLKRIAASALGGTSSWTTIDGDIVWTLTAPLARIEIRAER